MFYQDKSSEKSAKPAEVTPAEGVAIAGFVGAAVISTKMAMIERFYFHNYEYIYFGLWLLALALIAFGIHRFLKSEKDFDTQVKALQHVWNEDAPESLQIGAMTDGTELYLSENLRTGHVQIVGTTGRGKTESVIVPWIIQDVRRKTDSILIDGKGDPGIVRELIRSLGEEAVKVFDLGNLKPNSATINPLRHGSAQQITDRIFSSFDFDDTYYRGLQYDVTGSIVSLIREREEEVSFSAIYSHLTRDDVLSNAIAKCQVRPLREKLLRFLANPPREREANMMGLLSQIAPFATGEVSAWVNGVNSGEPPSAGKLAEPEQPSVSDVLLKPITDASAARVLVILLPTLKYQKLGAQLGRMLLQELAWGVGERASNVGARAPFVSVFLDEFSSFAYEGFESILNKARSSNVALHLSHQSLGDLSSVSPDFAKIVNTNTNIKCLLGLNDPDSADFYARHIGTRSTEKITERAEDRGFLNRRARTGDSSIREVESYKVHPNDLKNFTCGQGVLHVPTPSGNVTEVVQFYRIQDLEVSG